MLPMHLAPIKPQRQHGAALLMVMILLVLGVSSYLLTDLNRPVYRAQAEQHTADVLSQAKDALLGYAMTYREIYDTQPPGYLPCPDSDGDGSAETVCGGAGLTIVGRFPWRTLGLPPTRDGSGACLWYAVSGTYKNNPKQVLTSNTDGTMVIKNAIGKKLHGNAATNRAIAVIFAPGRALKAQARATTGDTYCGEDPDIAAYLDNYDHNGETLNNATGNDQLTAHSTAGLWITASPTDTPAFMQAAVIRDANNKDLSFNDKLVAITPADYAPVYARMNFWVANEVFHCLERYIKDNSDHIANEYEDVLGTVNAPAIDTYRYDFETQIDRYARRQLTLRCEQPKCDKTHNACTDGCEVSDVGCLSACDAGQTACYTQCEADDYARYRESAVVVRAAYPWAAQLEITGSEIDYAADVGARFGRIPEQPAVGGKGDMLTEWTHYTGSTTTPKCFDETAGLADDNWGWWSEWKEQVFYGVDASRSADMAGYFLHVGYVAGHDHLTETISLLNPDTRQITKITPADVPNSTNMQLDDTKSNIVLLVAGRQLSTQSRASLGDKIDIRHYLEDRNDPGANTIPTGDELFYTQPSASTVTFNDTACRRHTGIVCEMP